MKLTIRARFLVAICVAATSIAVPTAPAPRAAALLTDACPYTSAQPTVQYGSTGVGVKQLQCELNMSMANTNLALDGNFGPATLAAVQKFQRCTRITQDGIAGPQTWAKANDWMTSTGFAC